MGVAMPRALPHLLGLVLLTVACASPPPHGAAPARIPHLNVQRQPEKAPAAEVPAGVAVVDAAVEMLGVPYRYGGSTPKGFDCSGLVKYAYQQAGFPGLPHSAKSLAEIAKPVSLNALAPGDILIFELAGKKPSHVGLYVGNRQFIHAPSSGGHVEIVDFDHVYWGRHIGRAGRLLTAPSRVARVD